MQDPKDLVDQGIEALMTGELPRAREILQAALKQDPSNERGWLALSFAMDKPEHALECVQRVLALNPQHEKARERLADLQASAKTSSAPRAQPPIQPLASPSPTEAAQWTTESDALQALGLIWGNLFWWGIVLPFAYYVLRKAHRRQGLSREGTLISGEIIQCSGYRGGDSDYRVKAEVRFRSPQTGEWIYDNCPPVRNDVRDKPMSRAGTPVHIRYIHDKMHEAL